MSFPRKSGNISKIARSLGLHASVLQCLRTELDLESEKAFLGKGYSQDEDLRQLQRENQRLNEQLKS